MRVIYPNVRRIDGLWVILRTPKKTKPIKENTQISTKPYLYRFTFGSSTLVTSFCLPEPNKRFARYLASRYGHEISIPARIEQIKVSDETWDKSQKEYQSFLNRHAA